MASYTTIRVREHDELADRDPLRARHTHDRRDEKGNHHGVVVLAEVPADTGIHQLAMSRERALDLHTRLEEALCEAMSLRPFTRPPVGAIVALTIDPAHGVGHGGPRLAGERPYEHHGLEVLSHGRGEREIVVMLPHSPEPSSVVDLDAPELLAFEVEALS